jgi:hypothetical protein
MSMREVLNGFILSTPRGWEENFGGVTPSFAVAADNSVYWIIYSGGYSHVVRSTTSGVEAEPILTRVSQERGSLQVIGSELFIITNQPHGGKFQRIDYVPGFVAKYSQYENNVTYQVVEGADNATANKALAKATVALDTINEVVGEVEGKIEKETEGLWRFVTQEARPQITSIQQQLAAGVGITRDQAWQIALDAQWWSTSDKPDYRNLLKEIVKEEVQETSKEAIREAVQKIAQEIVPDIVHDLVVNLDLIDSYEASVAVEEKLSELFKRFASDLE